MPWSRGYAPLSLEGSDTEFDEKVSDGGSSRFAYMRRQLIHFLPSFFHPTPLIRLVVAGIPSVCVFFVISGYAISIKLAQLSHQGKSAEFAQSLASSIFRRHQRLFMPATAVLLMSAIMSYFLLFPTEPWSRKVAIATRVPPHLDSLMGQLRNWAQQSISLAYPIRNTINSRDVNPYDPNLWTLPVEFGCSMLVFTLHAATHKFRPRARIVFNLALIAYALYRTEFNILLFMCGMFMADLQAYASVRDERRHDLPLQKVPGYRTLRTPLARRAAALFAFVFCVYLLSMPEPQRGASEDPFYRGLINIVPEFFHLGKNTVHYWVCIGAVSLVATIDRSTFLQRFFNTPFAQYLGKISFALYLVHGPIVWSLGAWLAARLVPTQEDATDAQYGWGVVLCYLGLWPVLIYVSDLATRLVDAKVVSFSRWVYGKLIVKTERS
ncbi:unnamed protein product [Parascedosporium putredinis]|uniref:Acyltransferase 3 domain-containing protein n=1 Tax=Parascedosporium putredinis TaxID=1442378 RepID=A0A9P1H2J3_9PEZI|nr:unnamed protein product [Parascedosporium putredinis]CAI7995007.1 unnamed protein product [Parascedosporium putredinis]